MSIFSKKDFELDDKTTVDSTPTQPVKSTTETEKSQQDVPPDNVFTESQLMAKEQQQQPSNTSQPAVSTENHPDEGQNVLSRTAILGEQQPITENMNAQGKEVEAAPVSPLREYAKRTDLPISEAYRQLNAQRKAAGQDPVDVMELVDLIQDKDVSKSLRDNEKEERKRLRQERWEQIGNLLLHVGNFAGAVAGAPAQKQEDQVELTERQKKVRDAILAQRKAYGTQLLSQVAKDRADRRAEDIAKANEQYRQQMLDYRNRRLNLDETLYPWRRGVYQSQIDKNNAGRRNIDEKTNTEIETRPVKVANIKAGTEQKRASAHKSRTGGSNKNVETVTVTEGHDRYGNPQTTRRTTTKRVGGSSSKTKIKVNY